MSEVTLHYQNCDYTVNGEDCRETADMKDTGAFWSIYYQTVYLLMLAGF